MGRERRRVVPGKTYFLTRRTTRRFFLFAPDKRQEMENIFWYCLAVTAKKFGVAVHAACLMSTHIHLVVTDVEGVLPLFLRDFHRLMAECTKRFRNWPEEVFNKSQCTVCHLLNEEAMLQEMGYTMANGSTSYVVRYSKDWPGAKTEPKDVGIRVVKATRPEYYFDAQSPDWPDEVELAIEVPALLQRSYGDEGARRKLKERVKAAEHKAWREAVENGRTFPGLRGVYRAHYTDQATSAESKCRSLPRIASGGDSKLADEERERIKKFDAAYDEALVKWQRGQRNVKFPYGTWWMRVHHKARCHPPPP